MIFCDLPTSNGEGVANEIGENVTYIPADVTSETEIQNLVQEIDKKYGKLNVLVNCAGLSEAHGTFNFVKKKAHSLSDFQKVLMVRSGALSIIIAKIS